MAAIVVVTFHRADSERLVFGPFADGDAASAWGFESFPLNVASTGDAVTWCWQDLIHPKSPYAEHLSN